MEPDGVLIEQSVRGRPDAFVSVVRRHEAPIHAYLARRAGRQAADDLLAEVWLRAFAARGGYDTGYADARPWLYGIARNVVREHWRASRCAESAAVDEMRVDPWDGIDDRLDSASRAEAVIAAVRALPAGELEVLLLVAWGSSPRPMPRRCSEFRRERRGADCIGREPHCAGPSSATLIQTR